MNHTLSSEWCCGCIQNLDPSGFFFVSPELSSVRDYVITHSVRSMCMYVVFCKIDHCIHIHWCIVMGLGHNDPWVESHMWPQQTWGQRSSRGQWPLVQVFGKKGQCIHILWCISKSNILQWLQKYVIAKAGETRGSRTALLQLYKFTILTTVCMINFFYPPLCVWTYILPMMPIFSNYFQPNTLPTGISAQLSMDDDYIW